MGKPNFPSNCHFYCLLVKDYLTQEATKGGSYKDSFKIIFWIFKFPCYYFTDSTLVTNRTKKIFSKRVYVHRLLYFLSFLNQFLLVLLFFLVNYPYQGIFARGTLIVTMPHKLAHIWLSFSDALRAFNTYQNTQHTLQNREAHRRREHKLHDTIRTGKTDSQ